MTITETDLDQAAKLSVLDEIVELSHDGVEHEELVDFITPIIAGDGGIFDLGALAHLGKKVLDILVEADL